MINTSSKSKANTELSFEAYVNFLSSGKVAKIKV